MDRNQKKEVVSELKGHFDNASVVVVTHYKGLSVAEITRLRKTAKAVEASFVVTKNSLAKIASEGTQYEGLKDYFTGPTAIAFSADPVAAAKIIVDFAKDNEKLVILGGAMQEKSMNVDSIKALAKLPSLDELRAKLVGIINTPAQRIAGVVKAPARQVAGVINAYSKKEGN